MLDSLASGVISLHFIIVVFLLRMEIGRFYLLNWGKFHRTMRLQLKNKWSKQGHATWNLACTWSNVKWSWTLSSVKWTLLVWIDQLPPTFFNWLRTLRMDSQNLLQSSVRTLLGIPMKPEISEKCFDNQWTVGSNFTTNLKLVFGNSWVDN